MSRTFTFAATRSFIAGLLFVSALALAGTAQDKNPIFAQDLEPLGFQTKPPADLGESYDFSSVTFLSEDLVLVAINKRSNTDRTYPSETSSRLATLLLFGLGESRLIRQEQKQVATFDKPIQATRDGHFLLSDGTGVQLCSAEFLCSARLPLAGPAFVSPKGTRAIIGGTKGQGQELIDTTTFDVLRVFAPNDPRMLPGDEGFLALKGTKISVMVPGQKDRDLQIEELIAVSERGRPMARFLNENTILGLKGHMTGALARSQVHAVTVDGKELVSVRVYNPGVVGLATSASGSRFCMLEAGDSTLNFLGHLFENGRLRNFVKIQVFDVNSGRRLFEVGWHPGPSGWGSLDIVPALSPSGHRLALIRKGVLQVYEIP